MAEKIEKKAQRKTQKKSKKPIFILTVLAAVVIGLVYLIISRANPVDIKTVTYGRSENKTAAAGYLIRNEQVYPAPADGVISYYIQEGERVSKGQKIAVVFTGKVDMSVQNKLSTISERISDLENSQIAKELTLGDPALVDNVIKNRVQDVIEMVYKNNTAKVKQSKDDITVLLSGSTGNNISIERLKQEKWELEQSISSSQFTVYADRSGVFSSVIDGMESFFDVRHFETVTPQLLREADMFALKEKSTAAQGEACVKVADNYEWFFAANVDEKWAYDLKKGDFIDVRFPDVSDRLIASEIVNISRPEDGAVTVVLACTEYLSDIYSLRRINAEIVRSTFSGLLVPKSAVRVHENKTGVYIAKDHIARFREAEIIFGSDDYVIIKEDNSALQPLLLYDEVIVSGDGIYSGKVIR